MSFVVTQPQKAQKIPSRFYSMRVFILFAKYFGRLGGKNTAYDHDKEGEHLAAAFLRSFTEDADFIFGVTKLVRWHMQLMFVDKNLPFADIPSMTADVNMGDIALLGLCDRLGRTGVDKRKEEEAVTRFLKKLQT